MAEPLPKTNRCHRCGEWFHNAHVCASDLQRALRKCCDQCNDGDGECIFPYYGTAPHSHGTNNGWIGSTRLLPRDQWGDNFREDPECQGHGIYMRCPHCGRGEQPNTLISGPSGSAGS